MSAPDSGEEHLDVLMDVLMEDYKNGTEARPEEAQVGLAISISVLRISAGCTFVRMWIRRSTETRSDFHLSPDVPAEHVYE